MGSEKGSLIRNFPNVQETQTEDLNSLTGVQSSAHHVENADIPSEVHPQGTTISEISDSVDHRPLADAADAPALKKPRIVHVNDITAPVQSLEKGTSSSSQNIGLLQEKADLGQKESSNLEELGGKPGGQLQEAGTESLELPVVSTFKTDGQFPGESMMMDSLPATSLDPFTNVAELVVDSMTGSAVDEAIGQFQKPGLEVDLPGGTATETITTVTTIIEEEIVTTTETVEMGTEPQNPDDAEEGEIVPEVVEDVTKPAEAVPSDANAHDSKDRGPESIAKPEVEDPKTSTTSITVDAESVPQGTEAAGPNSPLESEVTNS